MQQKLTIVLYSEVVDVLHQKRQMRQLFHVVEVIQIGIQSTDESKVRKT